MHRVAAPEHFLAGAADGINKDRKPCGDPVGAKPVNQSQSAGDVLRIQNTDQVDKLISRNRVSNFDAHRVSDSTEILNMCAVDLPCPISDPWQVCAKGCSSPAVAGPDESMPVHAAGAGLRAT